MQVFGSIESSGFATQAATNRRPVRRRRPVRARQFRVPSSELRAAGSGLEPTLASHNSQLGSVGLGCPAGKTSRAKDRWDELPIHFKTLPYLRERVCVV